MSSIRYEIKPFNEFTLRSCFYEAYLPAYSYLKGDELYFLLNNSTLFRYQDNNICFINNNIVQREVMEARYGIKSNIYVSRMENICDLIIEALQNEKFVLCRTMNSYAYDPVSGKKTEVSNGIHHWVLVFGYDTEKQEFDVLEHYTNVAALYYPLKMKFKVLESAYIESFRKPKFKESLYILWRDEKNAAEIDPVTTFQEMYNKRINEITLSNHAIISYAQYLNSCGINKIRQSEVIILSEITKYFRMKKYILETLGIKNDVLEDIINHSNLIRAYCIKCIQNQIEENYLGIKKYTSLLLSEFQTILNIEQSLLSA